MLLLRFICPFVYSIMIGSAWSLWSKKKFSNSLAPAYMLHILIVLLSGLIFKNLSFGIYGGIVIGAIFLVVYILRSRNAQSNTKEWIKENILKIWNEGLFVFALFYIFCYLINFKKTFLTWDEFSHWGMFLKECIRLDSLYCMSPLTFAHKDYVPAITLFEAIWCRLGFRYAEPDAYRAIQIFMFSMILPIFEKFFRNMTAAPSKAQGEREPGRYGKGLLLFGAVVISLALPLLFIDSPSFYHSIYCDVALGMVFFWCAFESYIDYDSLKYKMIVMAIGMSVFVLTKMTAMALLPLVVILYVIQLIFFNEQKIRGKEYFLLLLPLVVPVVFWAWFNRFVELNMGKAEGIQSYGEMKISSLWAVFIDPAKSSISYLGTVRDAFVDAIIHRDILIHGSYAMVIIFIVIALLVMSKFASSDKNEKRIITTGIWVLCSGIYYALLMYFLYGTAFTEYEAVRLASYNRYMNSFVVAIVFLLLAVYYDSEIWKKHSKGFFAFLVLLIMDLALFHIEAFDSLLPGSITHDDKKVKAYTDSASLIMNTTTDDDSIYIVKRGDNGTFVWHQRYYCSPRNIDGGSIGPMVNDEDIWSNDIEVDEFIETLKDYDYIYFLDLDEAFLTKYSDAFEDPSQVAYGQIYKISDVDSKVKLSQ